MKRTAVIKRLRTAAKDQGLEFSVVELTNHTGVKVGTHRSTIGRHNEVDELTVRKFFAQYEVVLGQGWWKR